MAKALPGGSRELRLPGGGVGPHCDHKCACGTEADAGGTRGTRPPARRCREPPGAGRGRSWESPLLEGPSCPHLDLGLLASGLQEGKLPPGLWSFVTEATRSQHDHCVNRKRDFVAISDHPVCAFRPTLPQFRPAAPLPRVLHPPHLSLQLSPTTSDRDAPNTQLCLGCSQPRVSNGSLLPSGQELISEAHYGVCVISPQFTSLAQCLRSVSAQCLSRLPSSSEPPLMSQSA